MKQDSQQLINNRCNAQDPRLRRNAREWKISDLEAEAIYSLGKLPDANELLESTNAVTTADIIDFITN